MDNFWDRVSIGGDAECWPWAGPLDHEGYGRYSGGKRGLRLRAHRVAFLLKHGHLDDTKVVMHSCDNPCCCNPSHLSLVTQAENLLDMHSKRRHPGTKLDAEKARGIRADVRPIRAIAKEYGVSPGAIYFVKSGQTWADAG